MKFGINILARAASSDLRKIAREIESAGFESLFLPEHTHIPVNGDRHSAGPETHDRMKEMPDPFIVLTAVAAVTTHLRIGTGISLIAQHDPIAMAKRIATIDQISNGRFMLGIGAGWNRSEARNHGIVPQERWSVMQENVLAMKQIWSTEQAEFRGTHVRFDKLWSWPKPAQSPGPPVIVGGEGPGVIDRVVDFGDMWGPHPLPGTLDRIPELQRHATNAGRSPIPVSLFNVPHNPEWIERASRAGVERCVLYIYDDGPETIEDQLEHHVCVVRPWL